MYSDNFDTSTVSFRNNFSNILGCIWLQEKLKLIFIIKIINIWILLLKSNKNIRLIDLDNIGDVFRAYLVNATRKSETASLCPFVSIRFLLSR